MILQRGAPSGRSRRIDACKAAFEPAQLAISEHHPGKRSPPDQAERSVDPAGAIIGEGQPALTLIDEGREIGLQFGRPVERCHPAEPATGIAIRRGPVRRSPLVADDGVEPVSTRGLKRQIHLAGARAHSCVQPCLGRSAASALDLGGKTEIVCAGQVDRTGERSGAEPDASAAAHHPNLGKTAGREGRPVDPAAERIGLRHSIEDHQSTARRVAAQAPQRNALAGRLRAAGIGAAEQLHPRRLLEQLVEPTGWGKPERVFGDHDDVEKTVGPGLGKRTAGHDDHGFGRRWQVDREHRTKSAQSDRRKRREGCGTAGQRRIPDKMPSLRHSVPLPADDLSIAHCP